MTTKKAKNHGPTAIQVATNVARLRKAQGLTRKELANRTNGLVSVEMLRGIENGESPETGRTTRRVDVDDLMVLALALNTSPVALLIGTPTHAWDSVEFTGLNHSHNHVAADVWRWATGDDPSILDEGSDPAEIRHQQALFHAYARPWWVEASAEYQEAIDKHRAEKHARKQLGDIADEETDE
ncbi:helix-turn-helix domain-containing protein [Nocardiopsis sp. NPDC055879]